MSPSTFVNKMPKLEVHIKISIESLKVPLFVQIWLNNTVYASDVENL